MDQIMGLDLLLKLLLLKPWYCEEHDFKWPTTLCVYSGYVWAQKPHS